MILQGKELVRAESETTVVYLTGKDMEKDLKEYKVETSEQMSIFEFMEEDSRHYSNTVDFLDLLPRFLTKNPKTEDGRLEPITFYPTVKIGDKEHKLEVVLTPARIKNKDGKYVDVFPCAREKVVELGIRKIAFSGDGRLFNSQVGSFFTLRQLYRLLKENKRGYNLADISEAIEILRKTSMDIRCLNNDLFPKISVNYISDSYIQTQKAFNEGVNDSKCFVVFNSLVTDSVNAKSLRAYNFKLQLKLKNNIADYLHFRITRNFTRAKYDGKHNIYHIKQSTLQRDTAFEAYKNYRDNKRQVVKALERLKKEGAIDGYDCKDKKQGRKIVDTVYELEISESFCEEIIKANIKIQDHRTFSENIAHAQKRKLES